MQVDDHPEPRTSRSYLLQPAEREKKTLRLHDGRQPACGPELPEPVNDQPPLQE